MLVKAGSTLLVPRSATHTEDVSERVAETALMALAPDLPPTRRVNMRIARGGESVASVARRWHVSTTQVAEWNHVSPTGKFGPGQTAVLFLPRSTSLARATPHVAQAKVASKGNAKVAGGNARSGTHVATSKAQHAKPAAKVAAAKTGGAASKKTSEKTKARVAQR
jgi:membrane-bound lytic murein transglycosylase D